MIRHGSMPNKTASANAGADLKLHSGKLDSTQVPFWINFGDAGIGYAFINGKGTDGRFLWQCC